MGAWGTGIFDNDTAADWGGELSDRGDLAFVEETLTKVIEIRDEYLGCEGLAACEVIARLSGKPGESSSYAEAVDQWVAKHRAAPSPALIHRAIAVVDRVVRAPSELLELWDEFDEGDEFRAVVSELRSRLGAAGAPAPATNPQAT